MFIFLAASCFVFLSACAPLATRAPEPTPAWFSVYAAAVWQPLASVLARCAPPGSAPAYLTSPSGADVVLTWGGEIASGMQAFQLGAEELVPIVSAQNTTAAISAEGLRLSYSGAIRDWDFLGQAPGNLTVWAYLPTDPISTIIQSTGLTVDPVVRRAPGPAELRDAVAKDPLALGLLPRRWLDTSVRELTVSDLERASFRAPLLALTTGEPQGIARAWLVCIQEHMKE